MQQLQHIRFTILQAAMQLWIELSSLAMSHSYVPVGIGFIAMENKTNDDKIRPWFER